MPFVSGSFSTTGRGTGVLKFSEMETAEGSDTESAKYLYQKGMRCFPPFLYYHLHTCLSVDLFLVFHSYLHLFKIYKQPNYQTRFPV
jgi:hypothetical protein